MSHSTLGALTGMDDDFFGRVSSYTCIVQLPKTGSLAGALLAGCM